MQFINVNGSKLRNLRPDVSVESQPNAVGAGKFHSRLGGGKPGSKGEKTCSVLPGGMLMAGLTLSRVLHVLVGFSAGRICLVHSSSRCITGKLDCG